MFNTLKNYAQKGQYEEIMAEYYDRDAHLAEFPDACWPEEWTRGPVCYEECTNCGDTVTLNLLGCQFMWCPVKKSGGESRFSLHLFNDRFSFHIG